MPELICPRCGQRLDRPTRFCPECGAQLSGPQPAAPPAEEGPAPNPLKTLVLPPLERSSDEVEPSAAEVVQPSSEVPPSPSSTLPAPASSGGAPTPAWADRQPPSLPLPAGAPPPYAPPGPAAPQRNRRLLWWLVGGLGCLALVLFGACISIGVLTFLGQRVGEGVELSATASAGDEGPPPRDAASASGELLLEDDFSDEMTSDLDVSEDETSRSAYEDGAYVVEVKVPEMVVWSLVDGPYTDISIEVEASVPAGTDVVAAGLIFHYQDNDNFYLYSVSNDGYYQLELLQNGEWVTLIDPTLSDAVDGGRNTLRVETRGARIALYVNGVLLEETADTTFTSGDAGLAVSTFEESSGTVEFDNLAIVRAE